MKFQDDIQVYGDQKYRDKNCPKEVTEQITFVNKIRREYPETYGAVITHIRNEGKRSVQQAMREKAEGMTKGASDIFIPGSPSFLCELKRKDHTKSRWKDGQQEYLLTAQKLGAFACVALGWEAAMEAFIEWLSYQNITTD